MSYLAQWLSILFRDDDEFVNRQISITLPPGQGGPITVPASQLPTYPNHGRTLLLNLMAGDLRQPFEQYISPEYSPLALPDSVRDLRRQLFGTNADRLGMNYWVNQFMLATHTTELNEYVLGLDPRITYLGNGSRNEFAQNVFGVNISRAPGTTRDLFLLGNHDMVVSRNGRLRYSWLVTIVDDTTVTLQLQNAPSRTVTEQYVNVYGLSDPHTLPGSRLRVCFPIDAVGSQWTITATARPSQSLADIVSNLRSANSVSFDEIFGLGTVVGATEPFQTFRNLWLYHPELPYQLSGLLCAAIYQTELARRGGL